MGDGTGCDNMTAVIVRFQKPLQDLQATINPTETEDVAANKYENYEKVTDAGNDRCVLKRSVSPVPDGGELEKNANKSKRIKTEESKVEEVNSGTEDNSPLSTIEKKESASMNAGNDVEVVSSS